jgi:four helix bundle protein
MRHNFKNLEIWKKSRALVKEVYHLTNDFPSEEKFGLTLQIRRSSISVPSNIAEGCGRGTDKQLIQFLNISIGSLCELETQIHLANDLEFIDNQVNNKIIQEIAEVRKMVMGFKNSIKTI